VVDFNTHTSIDSPQSLPICGIPVYYHRCRNCGFFFTIGFDKFTHQDFADHVYNSGYAAMDPEYAEIRPQRMAHTITQLLGNHRNTAILDYGGGSGRMAEILRGGGFTDMTTYDPFVTEHSKRPDRKFQCITCFEVFEHIPQPAELMRDLDSFLAEDGCIIYTTWFQPPNTEKNGMQWTYIGPRNGHISMYTEPAILNLTTPLGLQQGSFNVSLHAIWRRVAPFSSHFIKVK
jgi:2-polyprenyl-6-hydroxyphenyl methylase/3-demethylubiquinone-9 3-methyltransferase